MDYNFPGYVNEILDEWNQVALYSYEKYIKLGKGIVAVYPMDTEKKSKWIYLTKKNLLKLKEDKFQEDINNWDIHLENIDNYDPDKEIIINYIEQKNDGRGARIEAPDWVNHPKNIWLSVKVNNIIYNEDTNYLPEKLPEWFYDEAIIFFDKTKKTFVKKYNEKYKD